ncbi:MAG TPA: alpha/beta hydrolase [Thermoanaerobaculia bacterium]|nr:alpha/beta hydrolase [Thermoanaerobaculia bacterium]
MSLVETAARTLPDGALRGLGDARHRVFEVRGLRLHAVEAGPAEGPLLVLLHGFPEFWYGWRHQIAPLAEAGFRVLALDQRGYNVSSKPRGVAAYNLDELAGDVAVVIAEAAGSAGSGGSDSRAFLVGHDWGGAVAWWTALRFPDRVARMAVLNMPHPAVMQAAVRHDRAQRRRSLYIAFFQIPWLPERLLRARDWAALEKAMRASGRPDAFTDSDFAHYRRAWEQPGALPAMLAWYRAALRARPVASLRQRVTVPTLLLWGARDTALRRELARPSVQLCDRGHLVFLEEATHWLHHEEPGRVNPLLADFFE